MSRRQEARAFCRFSFLGSREVAQTPEDIFTLSFANSAFEVQRVEVEEWPAS